MSCSSSDDDVNNAEYKHRSKNDENEIKNKNGDDRTSCTRYDVFESITVKGEQ